MIVHVLMHKHLVMSKLGFFIFSKHLHQNICVPVHLHIKITAKWLHNLLSKCFERFWVEKAQEENQIIRNINEYYSSDVPLRNLTWGNAQTHLCDCPQEVY